jgi:hypothetical protein
MNNNPQSTGTSFDALARRAALAGRTLLQTSDGFILAKLTHAKHVADLKAVEALIRNAENDMNRGVRRG